MSIQDKSPLALSLLSLFAVGGPALAEGDGHCYFSPWRADPPLPLENFGFELAATDQMVAIQAKQHEAVVVYERQGSGWVVLDEIPNPDGPSFTFGSAMDWDGSRLAIANDGESSAATDAGRVYLYERVGDGMQLVETFDNPTPAVGEHFGSDVQLTAHWLAVGASGTAGGGTVYTYIELAGGWEAAQEVPGVAGSVTFGAALAMAEVEPLEVELYVGDSLAAGHWTGAVYNYRVTPGVFFVDTPLFPVGGSDLAHFGVDLDYDGERLVVGANWDTEMGTGAAFVYEAPLGTDAPVLEQKLFPDDLEIDSFGRSVALLNDKVLVGAMGSEAKDYAGVVHVFRNGAFGGIELEDVVEPAVPTELGQFGYVLAATGNGFVTSAPYADFDGAAATGEVYYVSLELGGSSWGPCPDDVLAGVETYGEGKPGSVGVPQLGSSAPVPGSFHVLTLEDVLVGTLPVLFWGTAPAAIPFDEGTFLIADPKSHLLPIVGVTGQVGAGWNVPLGAPALYGFDIYAQAILLDPGAGGALHTAQSNGVRMTIGF